MAAKHPPPPKSDGYRHQEVSCYGKTRYDSYSKAEKAAKGIRRHGANAEGMQHYHCRFCSGWHLGHRTVDPKLRK